MTCASMTLALAALAASFSFADGHMPMYMGVDVHTDGGMWQEVDGRLAQTDASAWLAGATAPMGIQGKAEYSFDVAYLGGLEDNAIGFGALVPGFAMGLVWDPATFGGSGLRAQVYNEDGEIHEYGGVTYDIEIPEAMIAGITAEMVMNATLPVRIRIDSSNGNVWVKDPFDATTWWAFTLGQSLEGEGHNMIGVGTTSAAASFWNIDATPLPDITVADLYTPIDQNGEVDRSQQFLSAYGFQIERMLADQALLHRAINQFVESLSPDLGLRISFRYFDYETELTLSESLSIVADGWELIRAYPDETIEEEVAATYRRYISHFLERSADVSSEEISEEELSDMGLIVKIFYAVKQILEQDSQPYHDLIMTTKHHDGDVCGLNVHGSPRLFYEENKGCYEDCLRLKDSSPAEGRIALGYWILWAMDSAGKKVSKSMDYDLTDPPGRGAPTKDTMALRDLGDGNLCPP